MHKNIIRLLFVIGLLIPLLGFTQSKNVTDNNGLKQGYWEKLNGNGKIVYKGQFKDGTPYGAFKYYDETGAISSVLKHINSDTVLATFFHVNGKKAAYGYYVNKEKEGVWRFYDKKGVIASEEEYSKGLKNGKYIVYNLNGTISRETYFVKGIEHGYRKTFDNMGNLLTEGTIKDGQMDGEQIIYRNGKINIKGSYKHAVQDGEWIFYDADGKPYKTEIYELGYKKN